MDTIQANQEQIREIDRYIWILGIRIRRDPRRVWGNDRLYLRWIRRYSKKWRIEVEKKEEEKKREQEQLQLEYEAWLKYHNPYGAHRGMRLEIELKL